MNYSSLLLDRLRFDLAFYLETIIHNIHFPLGGKFLLQYNYGFKWTLLLQFLLVSVLLKFFSEYKIWRENQEKKTVNLSSKLNSLIKVLNSLIIAIKIGYLVRISYFMIFKLFHLIKFILQTSVFKEYLLINWRLRNLRTYSVFIDWLRGAGYLEFSKWVGKWMFIISENNTRLQEAALRKRLLHVVEQLKVIRLSVLGFILSVTPVSIYCVRAINYLIHKRFGLSATKLNVLWTLVDMLNSLFMLLTNNKTFTSSLFTKPFRYWSWYEYYDNTCDGRVKNWSEIIFKALFECLLFAVRYGRHTKVGLPIQASGINYGILSACCYHSVGLANSGIISIVGSFVEALVASHRIYNLYLHFKPTIVSNLRNVFAGLDYYLSKLYDYIKLVHRYIQGNPIIKFNIENNPNLAWVENISQVYLSKESQLTKLQDKILISIIYLAIGVFTNRYLYFPVLTRMISYQDLYKCNFRTMLWTSKTYQHNLETSLGQNLRLYGRKFRLESGIIRYSQDKLKKLLFSHHQGINTVSILLYKHLKIVDDFSLSARNINYLWLSLQLLRFVVLLNPDLTEKLLNRVKNLYFNTRRKIVELLRNINQISQDNRFWLDNKSKYRQ